MGLGIIAEAPAAISAGLALLAPWVVTTLGTRAWRSWARSDCSSHFTSRTPH